jgi:hypothetical protein
MLAERLQVETFDAPRQAVTILIARPFDDYGTLSPRSARRHDAIAPNSQGRSKEAACSDE